MQTANIVIGCPFILSVPNIGATDASNIDLFSYTKIWIVKLIISAKNVLNASHVAKVRLDYDT
jgi:hypothetical protein